ncbi:hypothetical protein ACWDE0_21925 [Streptomyces sp. 900105755]
MTTDPRARQLAQAVHELARQKATRLPEWKNLPLHERQAAVADARLWLRAAIEMGLAAAQPAAPAAVPDGLRAQIAAALRVHYHCPGDLDPDGPIPCACGWMDPGPDATAETDFDAHMADVVLGVLPTPNDRTALRDRIAEALTSAAFECDGKCGLSEQACYDAHPITFSAMSNGITDVTGSVTAIADIVLGVLAPPTDRAAVLLEVADWLKVWRPEFFERWAVAEQDRYEGGVDDAADELRRLAAETPQTQPGGRDALMRAHTALAAQAGHDQAALARVRTVLETEAVVGRTALDYRGLIATALMGTEPQQDGVQS